MPSDHLGLGPFLSQVRSRAEKFDAEELRALLLAHAESLEPAARAPFLSIFTPARASARTAEDRTLLDDIAAFVGRIRGGDYVDGWGWDDDLHDERNWGDESWVIEMDELFAHAAAAFLGSDRHLARDAYCELLDVLGLDDEGGTFCGALPPDEMLQTDIAEAKARALRLLFETATPAERVDTLAAAFNDWRYVGGPVGLRDILDTRPEALPDVDAFAEEWVARFSSQPGRSLQRDERAFLIELASWCDGPDGVGALARRCREDMPELFVAWVDALAAAGRERDAAAACTEALGLVPAFGAVRAELAERYAPLVEAPGHRVFCASTAWRAAPTAARLRRLAACCDDATIVAEADAITAATPPRLVAALLVLAGRIDDASALLRRSDPLGWSRSDHPGPAVAPVLLIAATAPDADEADYLPAATALLTAVDEPDWCELAHAVDPDNDSGLADTEALIELSALLCARAATASSTPDQRARWLSDARAATDTRVAAIVTAKHRGAYDRAAQLATAHAEAVAAVDGPSAATAMLIGLRDRYPRHVAFRSALEGAIRRSPRLSPLPSRRR